MPAAPPEGQKPKILHICLAEKFIEPFIEFLEGNVADFEQHVFFCLGRETSHPLRRRPNIRFQSDYRSAASAHFNLNRQMYQADKIIIHCLWSKWVVRLLSVQPWLLRKCYWVIWGADLYSYQFADRSLRWHLDEIPRRIVIKRFGHLITQVEGDVDLARQWYGARGRHHDCFVYPSNLYKKHKVLPKTDTTVHIQIGNSADPRNEYLEMLEMLKPHAEDNIKIYAMLSYGSDEHAAEVAALGANIFGEKFEAITGFMRFDEYIELLSKIDIAIFNHRRQQAMGNIVTLLGLGKKVFIRRDISTWKYLAALNIKVFAIGDDLLDEIDAATSQSNIEAVQKNFSVEKLTQQLSDIFYE